MNEEGSLFDVPPAALGRFRVQHAIGAGASGPVFRGEDPDTHDPVALKAFGTGLGPERAHALAQALSGLADDLPSHDALAAPLEAGLDETEPFLVSALAEGDALDKALREFGPAAIVDLVPRLAQLAEALDLAASHGFLHGALKPGDVRVSAESTKLTGVGLAAIVREAGIAPSIRKPYASPEVASGGEAGPRSDQFSLAVIAYEWLFGRPPAAAAGEVSVPSLPGVDRAALVAAFSRAMAADPADRFESCTAFSQAVSASVLEADAPVAAQAPAKAATAPAKPAKARAEVARLPLQDAGSAPLQEEPAPVAAAAPERWAPTAPPRREERWSNTALVVSWFIGALFGLLAGYMAIPRALMQNEPRVMPTAVASAALPEPSPAAPAAAPAAAASSAPASPAPAAPASEATAPAAAASAPAARPGRHQVRSTPPGAAVSIDGVERGVTPLAVRDLDLGSRHVVVSHAGYAAADRRVVLSAGRPSRSIDVRLQADTPRATAAARPGAAGVGSVLVDSRPRGAQVTIDGRPAGVTPVTIDEVAAGEHRITIVLTGYQPFAATVRVAAGERARAAASLVGAQEKE